MAARKRSEGTGSLFIAASQKSVAPAPLPTNTPVVAERKSRVVPREDSPSSQVIVEFVGEDVFEVCLLRHHGTTLAAIRYTRLQLQQLVRRATAALEAG